ncbi:alpha/beta hydrolase [uncultured Algimonas sp.]|uniref:alpha/beta fold hydrolase n=1 Tax=uncultured Algimonas sp. TaxID=1547920 RepID=UPI002633F3C8|nr:alpha/beta hydrolase [uncultured Algimonas sp.]
MNRLSIDLPDGTLSALRFGEAKTPLRLIFCHANGFNAQSYRAVLEPLLDDTDGHILALDLRGHGRTNLPTDADALDGWQVFADDIAAVFDAVADRPVVLAGHSYGAVSALLSLPQIRGQVSGYVGFDPVLVPWVARQVARSKAGRAMMKRRLPIARQAGQRRAVFESLDAAFARYQDRGAFRGVPDAVLRDYLEGGLLPTRDGRLRLACDPSWEQAIFVAQAHDLFRRVPLLPDNSRIVFAGAHGAVSTKSQRAALGRRQPGIAVDYRDDLTHLFPLQDTRFATDVLRGVLERAR